MDISFWKNLCSNSTNSIQINYASKQFYKQYFYRLELHAPGCKSIRCENLEEDIEDRKYFARKYNPGGSWANRQLKKNLELADIGWLKHLRSLHWEYPEIKIRTEEPKLSLFATDETMLKSFVGALDPNHRDRILSITGPENKEIRELLSDNKIIVRRPPDFKFRVFLRESQYSFAVRTQIYTYLTEMGDLVKIPEHTKDSLNKPYDWIWSCYFYTNDKGIADFVRIINPHIVKEVSEVVYLNNK